MTQRKNILNALDIREIVLLQQHHGGSGITEASVAQKQQWRHHNSSGVTAAVQSPQQ